MLSSVIKNVASSLSTKCRPICLLSSKHLSTNFSDETDFMHDFNHSNEKKRVGEVVSLNPTSQKSFRRLRNLPRLEPQVEIEEDKDVPKYVNLGAETSVLGKVMLNVKSPKMREKSNQILLEGKRLLGDALQSGAKPIVIFCSRPKDLKFLNVPEGTLVYKVLYKNLELWSDVVTSQGILGIFEMPQELDIKTDTSGISLTIICDNIRDPGNMGAILRTSAAVGCNQVLLTKGCVDLWEPKVLRSAAGAHFRLRIKKSLTWDDIGLLITPSSLICLAENDRPSTGLMPGACTNVPLVPYYSHYAGGNVVLVVGGETEGVSREAYTLAETHPFSKRVYIPLLNGVESLNSGTALGIIAYEVRRHLSSEETGSQEPELHRSVGLYTE